MTPEQDGAADRYPDDAELLCARRRPGRLPFSDRLTNGSPVTIHLDRISCISVMRPVRFPTRAREATHPAAPSRLRCPFEEFGTISSLVQVGQCGTSDMWHCEGCKMH